MLPFLGVLDCSIAQGERDTAGDSSADIAEAKELRAAAITPAAFDALRAKPLQPAYLPAAADGEDLTR